MQILRDLRKAKGLTMKELGDVVGVAESTISQYETGKRSPDFETLLKFGEFFDVTVDYLLGRDAKNKKAPPYFEGLDPEEDRAYFSVMAKAKRDGFSAKDMEAIADVLRIAKKREEEAEAESE